MRKNIIVILFLFPFLSMAQGIYVKDGNMTVFNNSCLSLHNSSLKVDGKLIFNNNSKLNLSSYISRLHVYGDILVHDLLINSDCVIDSDITVNGDIEFKSGIVDVLSNSLLLNGSLIDERDDSYIFSSESGDIVIRRTLSPRVMQNPGNMGLNLMLKNYSGELEIRRSNSEINYDSNRSLLRSFSFSPDVHISNIEFSYFNHEKNGLDDSKFSVWYEKNLKWNPLKALVKVPNKIISENANLVSKMTLFSTNINIDVDFPNGFSPNDDGINDYYIIGGLDKYPKNEFIVFNKWGNIVYRKSPYKNDWNGFSTSGVSLSGNDKLIDGTYFYFFFKNKNNKKAAVKGFFEIRTK